MQAILLDTSLYISALRRRDIDVFSIRQLAGGEQVWLSAVVVEELYAGASASESAGIEEMERDFLSIDKVLVPNLTDWTQAGKMLQRLGEKYGYENIRRGRLSNDALIATSAVRTGIRVITANGRDFSRLAEFCSLSWQLAAF
jgi:predicted nucleic acid-binding protein